MDRALVAISILLAVACSAAAEPPATAPPAPEATASAPPPIEPTEPATALAADASEPAVASAEAAPAPATADDADAAPTANADDAAQVPTVDMKKLTDDTVCRKERPTGSLIGIMRCYSRGATAVQNDELMRRDIEEMRMRQNDQQAREAAAAMTRRRPGP